MHSLGMGSLMGHSHYKQNWTANYIWFPKSGSLHITKTVIGRTRAAAAAEHHQTSMHGLNSRLVQQFHTSPKTEWES